MKLLVLRGNPRKSGHTQHFTDLFMQGVRATDAEVTDIDLMDRTITPCRGCYHCWLVTPGQCILRDDMADLLRAFRAADVVVCASPLYFYSVSSRMQIFLERLLPLTEKGLDTTVRGLSRNKTRYPANWAGKTLILLVVGALREAENFQPLVETYRLIADGLDMKFGGVLIRPESHLTCFPRASPKRVKTIEAAFVEAGTEVGRTGQVSELVRQTAAMHLAPNASYFKANCDVYWANAQEMGVGALNADELVSRVSQDARILMPFMVSSVDPVATARIKAVLQFDFDGTDEHYRVVIDCGAARLMRDTSADPDLRVSCTAAVWAGIARGDLNPRDALRQGLVTLAGDRSLFARLSRFFPVVG